MVPIEELIGKRGKNQLTMDYVPYRTGCCLRRRRRGGDRAALAPFHYRMLDEDGLLRLFDDIEMPLVPVLADMELTGVALDIPWLQQLSTIIHASCSSLPRIKIYLEAKHQFNINSSQQLGQVLFEELKLPGPQAHADRLLHRPRRSGQHARTSTRLSKASSRCAS